MVWGLIGAAALATLPSLIMGERQIRRSERQKKEEKSYQVADITRSFNENLLRSKEDLGLMFGSAREKSAAGGSFFSSGDYVLGKKREEIQSNMYQGYRSMIGALGYQPMSLPTSGSFAPKLKPTASPNQGKIFGIRFYNP